MDRMFRLQIYYRAIGNVKRFGVYFWGVPECLSSGVPEPLVCG